MEREEAIKILVEASKKSIKDCFETLCPMPIEEVEILDGKTNKIKGEYETVGIISINGDVKGSFAVHLRKDSAANIAKVMLGMDTIEDEADIYDTVGEVANVVTGGTKTESSYSELNFDISCPTVIRGDTHAQVESTPNSLQSHMYYKVDSEPLLMVIDLLE